MRLWICLNGLVFSLDFTNNLEEMKSTRACIWKLSTSGILRAMVFINKKDCQFFFFLEGALKVTLRMRMIMVIIPKHECEFKIDGKYVHSLFILHARISLVSWKCIFQWHKNYNKSKFHPWLQWLMQNRNIIFLLVKCHNPIITHT